MNILLDYFFPVTAITPTPAASTAFLKQACVVVLPKSGATEDIPQLCTSNAQIAAVTDNVEAQQFLAGGASRVYVLAVDDFSDMADILEAYGDQFYTLIISSDFNNAAIDGLDVGGWEGVIAASSTDDAWLATFAATEKQVGFHTTSTNKAKNMCFAFGKLLSAAGWKNQQYIAMPFADDVDTLGEATALFDDKISFVIEDDQFGERLALFAAGSKAIVAPYITKNLEIDLQSEALSYVSGNQPPYTKVYAALLEDELQKVIDGYIERAEIEAGEIEVKLEQANFVASAYINIAEPKALWRVTGQIQQTL